MMVNHQPNPNDEVVKCVVVGDSGVGKTCLVCAWACNTSYDLKKLVKTHVATVWAIDHYQRDREILERSWCEVDGVRVSLRLWDTFGYHDKDRRFAYRGADVVLLCFSTVRPSSLRNVRTIWYPEIRRFCPTTPIVLVGTQADLRYLYNEDNYLKMEKGLMYRCISEKDIVTPAMGHEMAKDIGAPFYEASVLTRFGVSDVFINGVRAALIERRKLKFWNTQLRKVQRPLIQPPMAIPTPTLPIIITHHHHLHHQPSPLSPPSLGPGLAALMPGELGLEDEEESDLTLVAHGVSVFAHRVVLAMSCRVFEELFSCKEFRRRDHSRWQETRRRRRRMTTTTKSKTTTITTNTNTNSSSTPMTKTTTSLSLSSSSGGVIVGGGGAGGGGGLQGPGMDLVVGVDNDPFKNQSVTSDDHCLLDNEVSGCASSPDNNNSILAVTGLADDGDDNDNIDVNNDDDGDDIDLDDDSDDNDDDLVISLHSDRGVLHPVTTVLFSHPAMERVEIRDQPGGQGQGQGRRPWRTVVTLHPDITPQALRVVLDFLYSARFSSKMTGVVMDVKRAAELLGVGELVAGINSHVMGDLFMTVQLERQLMHTRQARLHTLALTTDPFLTDVVFEVDDGHVSAHKVLLMAGCEMMNAMFSSSFLESSADVVAFPGITCDTFRTLLEYIYTGEATSLAAADCLSLIETANRLCLPHLVSLAEAFIVSELQHMECKGSDSVEEAILLLEPAELYNAKQLSSWCEKFLSIHYREATQKHNKLFRTLPKERQEAIEKSRWPPVWYLKEVERYDRHTHDRCPYPAQRQRQDYNRCFTGCLCFSRRARHRLSDPVDLPI